MELNHLKYFYAVAREGGFLKASAVLRVAQPAITKTVKNLEGSLGVALFERRGRNVHLTKIGNDLYRKCEIIFGHVEEIRGLVNPKSQVLSGSLNIAAAEPIAGYVMPEVFAQLLEKNPGLMPHLTAATAAEAVRLVDRKRVELALLFHTPDLSSELEIIARLPFRYYLVVRADKATDKKVCSSFIGSREVDNIANRVYPTLSKLRKKYPQAEIRISSNSFTAHRAMVLAGMGVSILPAFLVDADVKRKALVRLLSRETFRFDLKVIVRRGTMLSPGAKAMLEILKLRSGEG